ncbi:MAG: hypothetical protein NT015_09160 [Alphaproteobacteria bacterium]|nr:hypothetical protein [Alphaproteobacteria bacterium]
MPLAKAIRAIAWSSLSLFLCACGAMGNVPSRDEFMRTPREIRTGAADSVIERVESTVDRAEVLAAVQSLVTAAPLCYPWPGLWLDASDRRNAYYARYDLMTRDWGEETTSASRERMREFVDLGFLVARERPDIGVGAVQYDLTTEGVAFLRGSPYGGARPQFCPNAQRRVAELTNLEFGQFDCGSLRVTFTHVADAWPTWARTEAARERVDSTWAPAGIPMTGQVTLGRQWFRQGEAPPGVRNGALRSLCLDGSRNVVGDDLNLSAQ